MSSQLVQQVWGLHGLLPWGSIIMICFKNFIAVYHEHFSSRLCVGSWEYALRWENSLKRCIVASHYISSLCCSMALLWPRAGEQSFSFYLWKKVSINRSLPSSLLNSCFLMLFIRPEYPYCCPNEPKNTASSLMTSVLFTGRVEDWIERWILLHVKLHNVYLKWRPLKGTYVLSKVKGKLRRKSHPHWQNILWNNNYINNHGRNFRTVGHSEV